MHTYFSCKDGWVHTDFSIKLVLHTGFFSHCGVVHTHFCYKVGVVHTIFPCKVGCLAIPHIWFHLARACGPQTCSGTGATWLRGGTHGLLQNICGKP